MTNTNVRRRATRPLGVEMLEKKSMLAGMSIGMNLDHVAEYNEGWMFTDAFLNSRSWISHAYNTVSRTQSWEGGGAVNVDSRGWPTSLNTFTNGQGQVIEQRLGAQMFVGLNGHYPAGVYRAQWRGAATLTWGGDATVIRSGVNLDGTWFADVNVVPTNRGIYLRVDGLGGAPLSDLHVWLPDFEGQSFVGQVWRPGAAFSPYHPLFLRTLQPFSSVRLMLPQDTPSSDIIHWSDRRSVDFFRQSSLGTDFQNGMAPELLIKLANDLNRDLWICMPHAAEEDYVRNLARLVRDTLNPGLSVRVEWSNEAWNPAPGFEPNVWLRQEAARPENAGLTVYDIWARNMREDFRIWREEFAGQSQRLVRVVAGQAATSWIMDQLLQRMNGEFDAISCDGYVTLARPQMTRFTATTTADQVIDVLLSESLPNTLRFLSAHQALADRYSAQLGRQIRFELYEAGPLLQNYQRQPYEAAFVAASHSPRLYDVYRGLLRGADAIGVDSLQAFVLFDGSPFGDNSHLAYQDQPGLDSPKYRALLEAIAGTIYDQTPTPAAPQVSVSVVSATAREQAAQAAIVRVSRTGDLGSAVDVGYSIGGTAMAADIVPLGGSLRLAAGEAFREITITPVDDALVEEDETVTVTLRSGTGYSVASPDAATVTIVDNDAPTTVNLPLVNGSFEAGTLAGWSRTPVTGNFTTVAAAFTDPLAPTRPHDGRFAVWGAGIAGTSGGGATSAGVAQRLSLSAHAAAIDAGTARLAFTGWGAGGGAGRQTTRLEVRFFGANAVQLGGVVTSNTASTPGTWTLMTASAAVPVGTRGVELRAVTTRPTSFYANRAGFDDLAATITVASNQVRSQTLAAAFAAVASAPNPATRRVRK
mgnify:CR=1 FL=1